MNELHLQKKELESQVRKLAPVVHGLKQTLHTLTLSDADRVVLERLYQETRLIYDQSRKELKKIKKAIKPKKKPRQKRIKPQKIDQVKLSYRKRVAEKVREIHKISGFHRRPTTVQGGAPGLGKKS